MMCRTIRDVGVGTTHQTNDGTDWALGTTSRITLLHA